jgi:transposase
MPALVATRFNPDMKAKYKQLTSAGKPAKVAPHSRHAKADHLANALVKADRNWTPGYA